jgi:hypothetical protein
LLWAWRGGGGDINPTRQNDEGGTPLHVAAFNGHLDVVQGEKRPSTSFSSQFPQENRQFAKTGSEQT